MGSSNWSSVIYNYHRRLAQRRKAKYIKKKEASLNSKRDIDLNVDQKSSLKDPLRSQKKRLSLSRIIVKKEYLLILTLLILLSSFILRQSLEYIGRKEQVSIEKNTKSIKKEILDHINFGYQYLNENNLISANRQFRRALDMHRYNKQANYGMTKTLLLQCQLTNQYCDDSKEFINFILNNKLFTEKEIKDLVALSLSIEHR